MSGCRLTVRVIQWQFRMYGKELRQVNANITAGFREVNNRIDRLFLAMLGIGAAQVGLLLTLVLRN